MKYRTTAEQLRIERRKNDALQAQLIKTKADLDYIAMMSDVELETNTEDEVKEDMKDE